MNKWGGGKEMGAYTMERPAEKVLTARSVSSRMTGWRDICACQAVGAGGGQQDRAGRGQAERSGAKTLGATFGRGGAAEQGVNGYF